MKKGQQLRRRTAVSKYGRSGEANPSPIGPHDTFPHPVCSANIHWPTPRKWQIYWFLVKAGAATHLDISYELGLPYLGVKLALFRLHRLGLVTRAEIGRPCFRKWRAVYGPNYAGLWFCDACEALFLPMPVWDDTVKYCPYCGSKDLRYEPKDPETGKGIAETR